MNAPDRFELYTLEEGQKKIEIKDETRVPNTKIFTIQKEDHTLGNLISQRLHRYPCVKFTAYKVPHPLFATIEIRITTDGSVTPEQILKRACQDAISDLEVFNRSFTTEWLGKRIVNEGEQDRLNRERDL